MVSNQSDSDNIMQELAERLVSLHKSTSHQNSHADREKIAVTTIRIWWEIYDHFVFWAQCELLGQEILRANYDVLVMLRDRGMLRLETELKLPVALGYFVSISDKSRAAQSLLAAAGKDQLDVVKMFADAGGEERGDFLRELLTPNSNANAYLSAHLAKLTERIPEQPEAGEHDLDNAHPTEGTRWKLEALRQVRIQVGRGLKKIAAMSEVSATLRRSIDELQLWERDLVKFSDYENDLFCAELVGELEDELRASHYSNLRNYKFYGSYKGVYNLERASSLAHHIRQVRISDIIQGLRSVR